MRVDDFDNRKFILFSGEHYNPLGIARSLGEMGIYVTAVILKNKEQLTSKSKYIKELYIVDSIEEGYERIQKLIDRQERIPFVYTADDRITGFLDRHYDELVGKCFFFNAGSQGRISYYINKSNIMECAKRHGLKVLDAIVVNKGDIPEKLSYPIITKAENPTIGAWKKDMFICNNATELKEAYEKIKSPRVILQKYIKKKNEYCLEGFSVDHGNNVAITIASTYNYLLDISYSPYMTVENFARQDIKTYLDEMYREIGFEGIFEIEFLVSDEDELYFGEINFRNSTWSYASTCAGMNLPYLWAKCMLQKKIDNSYYKDVPENFTAIVETTDFKERVIKKHYSIVKWLKDLKNSNCKYYIGKRDFRPIVAMILSRVFKKCTVN